MNTERSDMQKNTKPMMDQADSVIDNLGTMNDSISDQLDEARRALDSLSKEMKNQ